MANENNKFLSFSGLETLVEQIYNVFLTKNSATSTYTTKKEFDQFKQNIGDVVQADTSNLATKQELNNVTTQVNKNKSDIGNCLTKVDAEKTYALKSHTHDYADPRNGVYSDVIEDSDNIFDYITLERPMCRLFIPAGDGMSLLAECIQKMMYYNPTNIAIHINSAWDPTLANYFYNRNFDGVMNIFGQKMIRKVGVFFNIHTIEYRGIINAFIDIEIY